MSEIKKITIGSQLKTVLTFTRINTKRFFRDRVAQFFAILFPLILLFVFGSLNKSNSVSFNVSLINQSGSAFARSYADKIEKSSSFKINKTATTIAEAKNKMDQNQLDGIIVLSPGFGDQKTGQTHPSGTIRVIYNESNASTGETLSSFLQGELNGLNSKYVSVEQPFGVTSSVIKQKNLTSFDYTFAGLLGFSFLGIGIFGPINVFPELKKQGILRRLHTTPLRAWQYFLATMFSQAITGLITIAIQFIVAIELFNLRVDGNYFEIAVFVVLSVFMILGIGLAIGGWAKNERQAAPISNIIVFPMLFLSGTFFPRYLMPVWLQKITDFLPLTPIIDGIRDLTTEGKSLFYVAPEIGLILAWMVVIYTLAFRLFEWE